MTMPDPAAAQRLPEAAASPLREAVREARVEAAERTGVVVDLRDAELARLEILNEALAPIFAEVPADVDLFDRGLVPGPTPRLWIDMLAHISMGRDKRLYRFLQDTRHGRRVLVESTDPETVVKAVTRYVARRIVERERALAGDTLAVADLGTAAPAPARRRSVWKGIGLFILGTAAGALALLCAAWFLEPLL